jgi:diguanylate cyclase (GGDEF)-like protein
MASSGTRPRSVQRLLAKYALLTLIPVVLLGVALVISFKVISEHQGLAEGRSEAIIVAKTAVEPQLDSRPLSQGLSAREKSRLGRLVHIAVSGSQSKRTVLRLRLRDLSGRVVFSDDRSGLGKRGDDDEALDAAHGQVVARLTHLNSDGDDDGPAGVSSVEVYLPLYYYPPHASGEGAKQVGRRPKEVGVLEMYLPYGPIAAEVDAGNHALYRDLALGLAGLFLVLFVITLSVSRGLRRELSVNAFLAHHDTLTELPNRALFVERAREAVEHANRTGRPSTLAILDLDHFKDINDTLGHPSGDQLLAELGRRLNLGMKPGDTVARLGGDEFGVVLREVEDPALVLQRLAERVASDIEVRGLSLSVSPSIGYVTVRDDKTSVETLMQQVDVAMYAAKGKRMGPTEYRPGLDRYNAADLELVSELPQAIRAGQLVLHYQPQTDVATGAIVAAEALVRWQHPTQGLLSPGRFIPMAEQTELIERITDWVLSAALADAAKLDAAGTAISVAVNVSARSIVRAGFANQVIAALEAAGVAPSRLVVEVTETALLTDPDNARAVLTDLSAAGISVSIDDFGQGQTSLGYLSDLPIDELKIDRGFVSDAAENSQHVAIVRSIIDLGHNLSMRVVGEGVEDEAGLILLQDLGCDLAQGFHLACPMPFDSLAELLQSSMATGAQL